MARYDSDPRFRVPWPGMPDLNPSEMMSAPGTPGVSPSDSAGAVLAGGPVVISHPDKSAQVEPQDTAVVRAGDTSGFSDDTPAHAAPWTGDPADVLNSGAGAGSVGNNGRHPNSLGVGRS